MDRISTTLDQSTEEPVRQQAARCMSNLLKLREGRDFLLFSTNCSTALAALTTLATPPPSGLAPFVEPAIRGLSNACLPPLEDLPSEVVKCEGLEEALARSLEIATREDAPPRLLSATLTCILNVSTVLRNYPSEVIVMDTFRLASPLVELIGSQSQAIQVTSCLGSVWESRLGDRRCGRGRHIEMRCGPMQSADKGSVVTGVKSDRSTHSCTLSKSRLSQAHFGWLRSTG